MEAARAQLLSDTFAEVSLLAALTCRPAAMLQAGPLSELGAPVGAPGDRGAVITGFLAGPVSLPPESVRLIKLPLSSPSVLVGTGGDRGAARKM